MRVLVVGASGFLGRHLAAELLKRGNDVVGTSFSGVQARRLDVADPRACDSVITEESPDVVVNLAGAGVTAGSAADTAMVRANRDGPVNVAGACMAAGARLVHVASSTEPLPGMLPESVYSQTKSEGTSAVMSMMQNYPAQVSVVRVHNAYGADQPRGRFVIDVVARMAAGAVFTIRYPERVRDLCFVDDAVEHLGDIASDPTSADRCFDVGTGAGITLRAAADMIQRVFGAPAAEVHWAEGPAADPSPSSVAGDAGMEVLVCPTTLAQGLRRMKEAGG